VIDESYLPFAAESESHSLIGRPLLNAVIINSMSKIFCLPGLRIGFIKSSDKLIRKLYPFHLPWSVNGPASEAVLWLMRHKKKVDDFITQSKRFIQKERDLFYNRLAKVPEVKFFTSTTPFILIQLPSYLSAEKVVNAMAKEKLLIRNCSNFHGLSQRFIRISLKDSKNNRKAVEILIETCKTQSNVS
jgi:threonine-phosphate decarboxylase